MDRLPNEIWVEIISHLDLPDRKALRLFTRPLNILADPHVFGDMHMTIARDKRLDHKFPELAALKLKGTTRTLSLDIDHAATKPMKTWQIGPVHIFATERIFQLPQKLSRKIRKSYKYRQGKLVVFSPEPAASEKTVGAYRAFFEGLRSLELQCWFPTDRPTAAPGRSRADETRLKCDPAGPDNMRPFIHICTQLTSLRLIFKSDKMEMLPEKLLQDHQWPALQEFWLEGITIRYDVLLDFCTHHAATLRDLTLSTVFLRYLKKGRLLVARDTYREFLNDMAKVLTLDTFRAIGFFGEYHSDALAGYIEAALGPSLHSMYVSNAPEGKRHLDDRPLQWDSPASRSKSILAFR